ncbi:MAG: BrnT family toxin [Gemmatimonadaceae bacterium]
MDDLRFDWDPGKARENRRKHGITFEEAQTVFADDHAILFPEIAHSGDDECFYLPGLSARLRQLVVIHCYREAAHPFASSRPVPPLQLSVPSMARGGPYETIARLLEGPSQSLRREAQTLGHHPLGCLYD